MVHARVSTLAGLLGVPLVDRSATESYVYDGQSIATRSTPDFHYTDHEVLHEVCHWMVAWPEQRSRPDYGLGSGSVADAAATGGRPHSEALNTRLLERWSGFPAESGGLHYNTYVCMPEELMQELTVQFMCCIIGPMLGIEPMIRNSHEDGTWDTCTRDWSGHLRRVRSFLDFPRPENDFTGQVRGWMFTLLESEHGRSDAWWLTIEDPTWIHLMAAELGQRTVRTLGARWQAITAAVRSGG